MKKLALLGSGISYSLSPKIHKFLMGELHNEGTYTLEDIPLDCFADNMERFFKDYDGFNITKPFKQTILPYLSECKLDAVNLVNKTPQGIRGYNVDGEGFRLSLKEFKNQSFEHALLLGAGGAAVAVVQKLKEMDIKKITVLNRSQDKLTAFCKTYGVEPYIKGSPDFVLNCTSAGLKGENPLPETVSLDRIKLAFDAIYAPPETEFLKKCALFGATVVNGLGMLVYQAILSQQIFFDLRLSQNELDDLANRTMKFLNA